MREGLEGTDAMQVQGVPGRWPVHAGVVGGDKQVAWQYFSNQLLFTDEVAVPLWLKR